MLWISLICSAFFSFSFLWVDSISLHWASSSEQLPPTLPQLGQVFGFGGSWISVGISSSGITTASPKVEGDWALSTFGASSFALTTGTVESVYRVSAFDGWTSALVVDSGADATAKAYSYSSTSGAVGSTFAESLPQQSSVGALACGIWSWQQASGVDISVSF